MATTTISTEGQVLLPAELRRRRGWAAGTKLEVMDTRDGVLLRAANVGTWRLSELYGILHREGPALSIEEMDEAVMREARARDDCG